MPLIGSRHAAAVTVLAKRMIHALGDLADVRIQFPVQFLPRSEPQPDIALVKYRADAYRAKHGILEYWVVDLVNRRVVRHRAPSGVQYAQVDEITAATAELPVGEIEIGLSDLW